MTTSHSPLRVLKAQADRIAQTLKQIERGEVTPYDPLGKIAASRKAGKVKFGIVMDDKSITMEMDWTDVSGKGEVMLSKFILDAMREMRLR